MNEIAQRYAQGLFELARETDSVATKKEGVEELLSIVEEDEEIELLLRAVKITKQEKKDFVQETFGQIVDKDVVALTKLLIDKGRVYYFKDILKSYLVLADEELDIVRATVYSARELKEEDMKRIQEALMKKVGKQVVLKNQVEESLIAGIKVRMGNNVTDLTMKNKIDSMKETLLKGGQA